MADSDVASLLPSVRAIAREAGQVVLRYYTDAMDVTLKADGSPVTAADRAAEAVIVPALHHLTPDIPVVSEEAATDAGPPAVGSRRFWLVDPLDGTREFVKRSDEFTVNVALIADGKPVLGVVYAPATGDLYAGAVPGRASHSRDGRSERAIEARPAPAAGLTVLESRSHGDGTALDQYLAGLPVLTRARLGSSLKFCVIASGDADLYARFGSSTMEWDTAAGDAVLRAAGGRVDTADGQPLGYGKPGFANPSFIARGRS